MQVKKPNPYNNIKLQSSIDYKFLATMVAQKLRNENYKPEWRLVFLKSMLDELRPLVSHTGFEKLEKTAQDLFFQKQQEEKAPLIKAAQEQAATKKVDKNTNAKKGPRMVGSKNRFGLEDDYVPSDQEEDEDYDD